MNEKFSKCLRCGLSEPVNSLHNGICDYCVNLKKDMETRRYFSNKPETENENPYLLLGFFEFAILSTLMIAFFPWSLLFCALFLGIEDTKQIIIALIHDFIKTIFAILIGLIFLVIIGVIIFITFFAH